MLLQAALNNGLTVSWNPAFSFAAQLALKKPFIPCHWGVWDKFNNSLVIEFGPSGMNVFPNPTGVLTNNPLFPQQLQVGAARRFFASRRQLVQAQGSGSRSGSRAAAATTLLCRESSRAHYYLSRPGVRWAPCGRCLRVVPQYLSWWQQVITSPPYTSYTPTIHNTTFFPPPGSYNSSDRFARLAVLKSTANQSPWRCARPRGGPKRVHAAACSRAAATAAARLPR